MSFFFGAIYATTNCGDTSGILDAISEQNETSTTKEAIIGGQNVASNDLNDVYVMAINGVQVSTNFCTAIKLDIGTFLTAAHCVTPTRPEQSPPTTPNNFSTWRTKELTFTNINAVQNSIVSDETSCSVQVHPNTKNYTNNQWSPFSNPTSDQIDMDIAVVTTNSIDGPKDTYGYTMDQYIQSPNYQTGGTAAGYGYSSTNNTGGGIKRYIFTTVIPGGTTQSVCWGTPSKRGWKGDSGGPLYPSYTFSPTGIISVTSVVYDDKTCGPLLRGQYFQWLKDALAKSLAQALCRGRCLN